MTHFVNLYAAPDGEQWLGCRFKTRAEAEMAGRVALPGMRRVAMVRIVKKPVSGLRRPKYEDMSGGAIHG